jgi:3-hydroxybutyryl-CoA dehydrogenase
MSVQHLVVVGAGQMGTGIAQVALGAGLKVTMVDLSEDAVAKARTRIEAGFKRLLEKGQLDADRTASALGNFHGAVSLRDCRDVDFAVEAVTENENVKRRIFEEMDAVVRPGGVLATNTSSIPITRIAAATKRPEAVIGMHFMNPVPVMKLVEIIRGAATSDETYATTRTLAEKDGQDHGGVQGLPGLHRQPDPHPHAERGLLRADRGVGHGGGH